MLSGSDTLFDGALHVGVAIEVSASGSRSFVMIPDATRITEGQPIYITRKVAIEGKNISEFLASKNVALPEALQRLLKTTSIACDAFYLAPKKRPATTEEKANAKLAPQHHERQHRRIRHAHDVRAELRKGLIGALAGDEALGKLFDINGAKVRVSDARQLALRARGVRPATHGRMNPRRAGPRPVGGRDDIDESGSP